MSEIRIPAAALEAGARAIGAETYVGNQQTLRDAARAAIAAALGAWPGAFEEYMNDEDGDGASVCVILPKGGDDE